MFGAAPRRPPQRRRVSYLLSRSNTQSDRPQHPPQMPEGSARYLRSISMLEQQSANARQVSSMTKKKIRLPDGRYLIYYSFDNAKDKSAQPAGESSGGKAASQK